jgi:glutathione S-transferase
MNTMPTIILHDLVGAAGEPLSPNCWRSAMALAHKGVRWRSQPVLFGEIAAIGQGVSTVPAIDDAGQVVVDSWAIAEYLEAAYPHAASLFGDAGGRGLAQFVQNWTVSQMHPAIFRMIAFDLFEMLAPADQPYFRQSREKRFGRRLEDIQAGREADLPAFRASLAPLRMMVSGQDFIGGAEPTYADYLPFGALQWARTSSAFRLLEEDDAVLAWFERCLDLHGGLGRATPGRW